jgi:hypothetical protein
MNGTSIAADASSTLPTAASPRTEFRVLLRGLDLDAAVMARVEAAVRMAVLTELAVVHPERTFAVRPLDENIPTRMPGVKEGWKILGYFIESALS